MVYFFDCFGVICSEIVPIWMERYFPQPKAAEIKEQIFTRADAGVLSEEDTYLEVSRVTGVGVEQIRADWEKMVHINTELVSYIRQLREKAPVYLLSNAMSAFLRNILRENGLESLFDRVYISAEFHLIKPSVEYYRHVLSDLSLDPAEAVMIDDNPKNIAGAVKAGLSGIVFRSNSQLFSDLEKLQ